MTPNPHPKNRIYRSRTDSVFFGVCGGIAEHFDFPPWGVRIAFIIVTLTVFPWLPILYLVLGFAVFKLAPPEEYVEDYESREFWNTYQTSRSEALNKVHRHFQKLDKRLQRLESIVTNPNFELEEELHNL